MKARALRRGQVTGRIAPVQTTRLTGGYDWQGQKDLNPRHAVLEQIEVTKTTCRALPSVEP